MSRKKKQKKTLEELLQEALVPKEEQPYEVPENWVWITLESVAEWASGGTPKATEPKYYSGDIPWLVIGDLNDDIVFSSQKFISEYGLKNSSAKMVPVGSIMIAMYGSIGKLGIAGIPCTTNQAIAFTKKLKNNIIQKYLFFYLMNSRPRLIELGKGGTQSNISQTVLKKFPFPLPPLPEQKRIVNRVESLLGKIEEAKRLIEEARESFEQRRAAILARAFRGELTRTWRDQNPDVEPADRLLERIREERAQLETSKRKRKKNTDLPPIDPPYELPEGWMWANFLDVAEIALNLVDPMEYPNLPLVAPDNIEKKTGRLLGYITTGEAGVTSPKHRFYPEQIVYSKIRPYLSKAILVDFKGLCSADMYPINSLINKRFLYHYMLSEVFLDLISKSKSRTVLPKINQKELNSILVPVPSLEEQAQIVHHIDRVLSIEFEANSYVIKYELENLTQSILSRTFRGELGTNDPAEESALELLKQTLAEQHGLSYDPLQDEMLQVAEQGTLYET